MRTKMRTNLKDWLKILFVIISILLVNTFPIILSIIYNNWWLMLLYVIIPILDGLLLILLKFFVDILKW